nr:uncharacterized protein LOC111429319 [Onthophagus taurus]
MAVSGLLICSIFVSTIVLCSHIQSPRTLKSQFRVEGNRPTRGFSEMKLSTSRGFGKRDKLADLTDRTLYTARNFGKRMVESNTIGDQLANSILLELLAAQSPFGSNLRIPKNWQNVDDTNYD